MKVTYGSLTALALALIAISGAEVSEAATRGGRENLLGVGQGISAPSSTSTVNFSSGFTSENPVGSLYQAGGRVTAQYDQNGSKAFGGEVGYGAGTWGIAGGYRKPDCNGCDGNAAGALGLSVSDVGLGIRFAEDLYAFGVVVNPMGNHRVGLMAELNEGETSAERITGYGVGYSYAATDFTFTIDASKRQLGAGSDDRVLVTPGLMVKADILQVSINDRISINASDDRNGSGDKTFHDFWFGIGFGGDQWHIAGYSDYVNEVALAGSLFF